LINTKKFRTKQEIEADYQRRKIVRKFKKRIQKFENSEMDAEMDLKKGKENFIKNDLIFHIFMR
jgi:putative transposon-encoded protein